MHATVKHSEKWRNSGTGWGMRLRISEGRGASLTLSHDGEVVNTEVYEYWEVARARAKAETLAELGALERVAERVA